MSKGWLPILAVMIFIPISCFAEKPLEFTDALLEELPANPSDFQKQFGGIIELVPADNKGIEKGVNIDSAEITANGFKAKFLKFQDYKIWRIELFDNTIKVGGIAVIGKTVEDILRVFGTPIQNDKMAVIYEAIDTTLILIPKDNRIISAKWGQIP